MSVASQEEGAARLELRLNGQAGVQETAGAAVRAFAGTVGLAPERATRLRAVIEELVGEALARPRVTSEGDAVILNASQAAGRVTVEVSDTGLPITAEESRRAHSRRLSALGFVDELHIRSRGKQGNLAACAVALGPRDADLGDERVLEPDVARASDEAVAALEIRIMTPADAAGLVRCIYRCYGYSYKDALLYEPRHIAHALRAGQMRSVVAARPDGTIVGHCAVFAESPGDPVPESGRLVVDPRFRGHGLAERMAELRLTVARETGFAGIWAEAVTNHTSSQREVIRMGGSEVGLLIGGSPGSVAMADLDNTNRGRRTLLATHTPLAHEKRKINLPDHHRELVSQLAERMGIGRETATGADNEGSGTTHLSTRVRFDSGLAHIKLTRLGPDVGSRVADEMEGLAAFDLGAVHLDVPLSDPAAAPAIQQLEALRFCFAAWMPDFLTDGDVLRLQRTGGHPVDTEHIECARPEGEELRDYVLAEWHRVRRAGLS